MDKPVEILLFDFLTEKVSAAAPTDVIYQLQLHDTIHQTIAEDPGRGIRISEAVGDMSPGPEMEWKEYDTQVIITLFSRVTGKDKTERQTALIDVFKIYKAVHQLLFENPTLPDVTPAPRVCDLLLQRASRGYDVYDGEPYAVVNLPLILNPSGARYTE